MEALVDSMVMESVTRMGLDPASATVTKARLTARDAVRDGYSVEDAHNFARSVLNPTQVAA